MSLFIFPIKLLFCMIFEINFLTKTNYFAIHTNSQNKIIFNFLECNISIKSESLVIGIIGYTNIYGVSDYYILC